MPSIGKTPLCGFSNPVGESRVERLAPSANTSHPKALFPANLSDHSKRELKAAVESPDNAHSSAALAASNAIGDGQMTLHSVDQAVASYVKVLESTPNGPEELIVRAKLNETQRYDILNITHSRPETSSMARNTSSPSTSGGEAQAHGRTPKSRFRNYTNAAMLSAQVKLGIAVKDRSLPPLTEEAKMLIKDLDVERAVKRLDKTDVRTLYQSLAAENQRLRASERLPEKEMWARAIDGAKWVDVSHFSARENLQLNKGVSPRKAKIFALVNTVLYPVGRLRDRLMSDQTRARLNAESQRYDRQKLTDNSMRPSSFGPLTFAHSVDESFVESNDELLEPQLTNEVLFSQEVDSQAYEALSVGQRNALDALVELIDEQGLESAVENMPPLMRQSFDGYQLNRSRFSQQLSTMEENGIAM